MAGDVEPAIHAERTNSTTAVAQVEAARGLLVHRVAMADGLVEDYRIVAPTEWNFHPAGSVTQALAALPSTDRQVAEMQAALFVTLMDPCVAWSLEVH
jgi:Ni,Fe-hydrogenase I large subunit